MGPHLGLTREGEEGMKGVHCFSAFVLLYLLLLSGDAFPILASLVNSY